jgi:hypothetical protein
MKKIELGNYVIASDSNPIEITKELLDLLEPSYVEMKLNYEINEGVNPPYIPEFVSISGKADYINDVLKTIRNKLFDYLEGYAFSEESLDNKLISLSKLDILMSEKALDWDLRFPDLYRGAFSVEVVDIKGNYRQVLATDIMYHQKIKDEIDAHHKSRIFFLELVIKYTRLLIDRINLPVLKSETENVYNKSLDLLEVWLGLKATGFLKGLNSSQIAQKRKDFFKLFNLDDINYNDKHNQIKQRQVPKFLFTMKLLETLKDEYEN